MIKWILSVLGRGKASGNGVMETGENRSVKQVMSLIYQEKRWGGKRHDFYSGIGSHSSAIVKPYVASVIKFLKTLDEKPILCDLGCGDFNVGNQLVDYASGYIGVDIVDKLIARNKETFKRDNLEFLCLNIVDDELPQGDCVLVRQVLQHLSNKDILKVLEKLRNYRYIIITEHIPGGNFPPNKDKLTGQTTRIEKGSGVVVTEAPFSMKFNEQRELLRLNFGSKGSQIVTTLYKNF